MVHPVVLREKRKNPLVYATYQMGMAGAVKQYSSLLQSLLDSHFVCHEAETEAVTATKTRNHTEKKKQLTV